MIVKCAQTMDIKLIEMVILCANNITRKQKDYMNIQQKRSKNKKEFKGWEEVPDEDLWEDGEISNNTCMIKIYNNVVADGKWRIIRKITKG